MPRQPWIGAYSGTRYYLYTTFLPVTAVGMQAWLAMRIGLIDFVLAYGTFVITLFAFLITAYAFDVKLPPTWVNARSIPANGPVSTPGGAPAPVSNKKGNTDWRGLLAGSVFNESPWYQHAVDTVKAGGEFTGYLPTASDPAPAEPEPGSGVGGVVPEPGAVPVAGGVAVAPD
jgi:hypothetical protein